MHINECTVQAFVQPSLRLQVSVISSGIFFHWFFVREGRNRQLLTLLLQMGYLLKCLHQAFPLEWERLKAVLEFCSSLYSDKASTRYWAFWHWSCKALLAEHMNSSGDINGVTCVLTAQQILLDWIQHFQHLSGSNLWKSSLSQQQVKEFYKATKSLQNKLQKLCWQNDPWDEKWDLQMLLHIPSLLQADKCIMWDSVSHVRE